MNIKSLLPSRQTLGIFAVGAIVGFMVGTVARTLIIGLIVLALVIGAIWFAASFHNWREKLSSVFSKNKNV